MKKILLCSTLYCLIFFISIKAKAESVQISTYYPCPEGIFTSLLVTEKLNFTETDPGKVSNPETGDLIYDSDQDSFQYFDQEGDWQDFGISEDIIEKAIRDYFD